MVYWIFATILLVAGSLLAAPQSLVDLDMAGPGQAVNDANPATNKRISGELPKGISENSGWQENIDLTYSLHREGERAFLRMTSAKGNAQLQVGVGGAYQQDAFFRLKITGRSEQRASIHLALRDDGAPYDNHFTTEVPLSEIWQDSEWSFRLGKRPQKYSLYIYLRQPGTAEISRITLTRESREDLIAATRAQSPEGGEMRNRVQVSRFPLGIQSGWGLDRDFSDEQFTVAADESVIGPSGSPSLKIVSPSGKPMRVSPPPFPVPWTFMKHTASLAVRGEGTLSMRIFSDATMWDEGGIANKEVQLTGGWQRIAVPFDPVFMSTLNQCRLTVNGTAWIDAFQVVPGDQPGEYAPRLPYEVALAWPKSQASAARIQFGDEPAILEYAVTGRGGDRPVLMAKVCTVYGEEQRLEPIPLSGDFLQRGRLALNLPADRQLGPFRVEAWVEDGNGKQVGSPNEAVLLRLRKPRYWGQDAPRSPFGTHMNSLTRHITLAKAIGMNWTRLHDAGTQYVGWSFLEPEKGQWTFFDEDLQRYRSGNMSILGTLATSPGWASTFGGLATGYWDRWVRPEDNAAFGNYVSTVVGRYKGTIDAWEIWNEPWGKFWSVWDKQTKENIIPADAAESFAQLSKVAYASAKKANPGAVVGGVNTYGGLATHWTQDMVKYGAAAACDVYTYHQYNTEFVGFPGDAAEREYRNSMGPILDANVGRPDKPVWFSEGNAHESKLGRGMYVHSAPGKYQDDVLQVSDDTARFSIRLLSLGVERFFYYTMHHNGIFRKGASPYQACTMDDGQVHPSAAAFSAMAWELEDMRYVRSVEIAPGVYANLFEGEGRSVAALTTARKWSPYKLPSDGALLIHDLFGNPVRHGADLEGRVVYISSPGTAADLERRLK